MAVKIERRLRLMTGVATLVTAVAGLSPSALAQGSSASEAIVVTAERRSQNVNDVPIAATVLTGTMLAERGVDDALDLQNIAPGTVINVYNRSAYVNIRGVGVAVSAPNVFQGVPFYMNGAVLAYDTNIRAAFYDLASVEVLRGPQGTLTGLNSTGGAVYMRSRAPALGVLSGQWNQDFSENNGVRVVLAGNLPIGDRVALRLAGIKEQQDSFTRNVASVAQPGDLNNYGARGDLLFQPSDSLRINLRAEYLRTETDYNAVKRRDDTNPNPFVIAENAISQAVINSFRGDLEVNWDATEAFAVRYQLAYGDAYQFDLGDRNRAIGGATDDVSFTGIEPVSLSHEVNLISSGSGPLQWVIGGFYLENEVPTTLLRYDGPVTATPPILQRIMVTPNNEHHGVFGQATYAFNEQWEAIVGARYSEDEQIFERIAGVAPAGSEIYSSDIVTGRVALNYTPSEDVLFYGSVARGYKAGGVNLTPGQRPFVLETNLVGEVGLKWGLLDQRLQVNTAAFVASYEDAQFAALVGGLPSTANAPSVASHGAELELLGYFGDFSFNSGVAFLSAEFDEATTLQDPGTNTPRAVPAGRRMTFSPEWTFNAGLQYEFRVGEQGVITPRLQYQYVGDQFATPFPDGATPALRNSLVPSHGTLDARLTYAPNDMFSAELFVTNVTDEVYIASQLQNASSQIGGYIYGQPRVAGIRLRYSLNE